MEKKKTTSVSLYVALIWIAMIGGCTFLVDSHYDRKHQVEMQKMKIKHDCETHYP